MADRSVAFVVIALCVVALALTASTLSSGRWAQEGSGTGSGTNVEPPSSNLTPTNGSVPESTTLFSPDMVTIILALAMLLGIPGLLLLSRTELSSAVIFVIYLGIFMPLVAYLANILPGKFVMPYENQAANSTGGGGTAATGPDIFGTEFSLFIYGILGFSLLLAVGLIYVASSSVDSDVDVVESEEDEPDMEEVGQAAGMAADYIAADTGDLSNGVYEAYHELTTALEVPNPETATPGEFATAAVGAGLDPDRVDEITHLFEEVRYGDEPPSAEREQRALDALRAIEAEYADGDDEDDADTTLDLDADTSPRGSENGGERE